MLPYGSDALWPQVRAGIAESVVTVPVCLALALASGLPGHYGLDCAVAGGVVASLASRRSILAGPSMSLVAMVADVFARFGPRGLTAFTAVTGAWLLFLHVAGLAPALAYIAGPIRIGLTNGFAVVAAGRLAAVALVAPDARAVVLSCGLSLVVAVVAVRPLGRTGATLAALAVGAVSDPTMHWPTAGPAGIEGLHFRLSVVRVSLPEWILMQTLAVPALCAAVLCAIESGRGKSASRSADRRPPNERALLFLGLGSVACAAVGAAPARESAFSYPAAGRAAYAIPVAGVTHAVAVAAAAVGLALFAQFIPVPAVCGIALAHVLPAGRWGETRQILRGPRVDALAWLASAGAFITLGGPVAVLVALCLSAYFVSRVYVRLSTRPLWRRSHRVH
jgi:SulP family sulfate permease